MGRARQGRRHALAHLCERFDQFIDESTQLGPANQANATSILKELFENQANPTAILKELCGAVEYKHFGELEAMKR